MTKVKRFYIVEYPYRKMGNGHVFHLIDEDSQEIIHEHFCTDRSYARGDLFDSKSRQESLRRIYGDDVAFFCDPIRLSNE